MSCGQPQDFGHAIEIGSYTDLSLRDFFKIPVQQDINICVKLLSGQEIGHQYTK